GSSLGFGFTLRLGCSILTLLYDAFLFLTLHRENASVLRELSCLPSGRDDRVPVRLAGEGILCHLKATLLLGKDFRRTQTVTFDSTRTPFPGRRIHTHRSRCEEKLVRAEVRCIGMQR